MMTAFWIVFLVFCVIAEAATSISLITIWFIPGTIIAAILSALNVSIGIQIVVFLMVSILSLYMTRKIAAKQRKQSTKTNKDSLIGRTAILQGDCSAHNASSVKFGDVVWTVKTTDEELPENTLVEVVRIVGNTLIVKKGV